MGLQPLHLCAFTSFAPTEKQLTPHYARVRTHMCARTHTHILQWFFYLSKFLPSFKDWSVLSMKHRLHFNLLVIQLLF